MVEEIVEVAKLPTSGLVLQVSGSTLEMTRETDKMYEYRTVDMSKNDIELDGADTEGFLRIRIVARKARLSQDARRQLEQAQAATLDLTRRRIDSIDVKIPSDFGLYFILESAQGSKYEIYKNQGKHFLLKVRTHKDTRLHNLGDLDNPKSYIARFGRLFETEDKWLSKEEIKSMMREARMYDGQKMTVGLEILERMHVIKKLGTKYANINLKKIPSATEVGFKMLPKKDEAV
ncbi:MAG: hypothetical protein QXX64_04505 [Nitrososphaera sp.]